MGTKCSKCSDETTVTTDERDIVEQVGVTFCGEDEDKIKEQNPNLLESEQQHVSKRDPSMRLSTAVMSTDGERSRLSSGVLTGAQPQNAHAPPINQEASPPVPQEVLAPAACTLTQADQQVGDHVCPVYEPSAVGYFESTDKLRKLFEASGEDLGRSFALDANSITATKEKQTGGFACAVSDPQSTDCPLVFVSPGFEDLTGYQSSFATGRSCRFLQPTSKILNDAVNLEERALMREFSSFVLPPGTIIINLLLNQRFTGERFWNLLRMQHVVVDGDRYIFAVQTNLDAYMPKQLLKAFKSPAKNTEIVKELNPFIDSLQKLRKELKTMTSLPMMELKGYCTASVNYLQLLPLISTAGLQLERPIAIMKQNSVSDDEQLTPGKRQLSVGELVEVDAPIRYPTAAYQKGTRGKINKVDAFGNVVVEWDDTSLGIKSVLKRDVINLKSRGNPAEVTTGFHPNWQKFYDVIAKPKGADQADGIAGSHSQQARQEIAFKLITNHRAVINDLTNTAKDENIEGKLLTQTYLKRIEVGSKPFVDQMLREVVRRLLGRRPDVMSFLESPDKKNAAQCSAWKGTAIYMSGRVQSKPEQKPGRKPDMSEEAAAAFLAVLKEVATLACQNDAEAKALSKAMSDAQNRLEADVKDVSHPNWQKFSKAVINPTGSEEAEGIANSHSQQAREEIARKLISNHKAVINDLTNTSKDKNIEAKPLTQTYLKRIEVAKKPFVDQMLREVVRRLLGCRPDVMSFVETPDPKNSAQCSAWRGTAIYMAGRVQTKPEQKRGRKPDMSEAAGAAFLAVLKEVATLACQNDKEVKFLLKAMTDAQKLLEADPTADVSASDGHPNWQRFYAVTSNQKCADAADGAAGSHGKQARDEITSKLMTNHRAVINDLTNSSQDKNIEGKPLTQTYLTRIDEARKPFVDQMLREVMRRLIGRRPDMKTLAEVPDKKNEAQCSAWRGTAIYLAGRVQSKPKQKPGRSPDMSEEAAAAFLAVLKEVAELACRSDVESVSLKKAMAEAQKQLEADVTSKSPPVSPKHTPRNGTKSESPRGIAGKREGSSPR